MTISPRAGQPAGASSLTGLWANGHIPERPPTGGSRSDTQRRVGSVLQLMVHAASSQLRAISGSDASAVPVGG